MDDFRIVHYREIQGGEDVWCMNSAHAYYSCGRQKNLTQQALADRAKALDPDLRLSDSVLGKYEGDRAVPRLTEAAALAEVLGVSLDFLTCGETSRTLPLKGLTETQIELLLELTKLLRQQNEKCSQNKQRIKPTIEQATLIAQLIQEIMG